MKKCAQCGAGLFNVEIRFSCDHCPGNGVWDPEACVYVYPDQAPEGRKRDQARMEWECRLGSNFNAGCRIFKCTVCGHESFVPNDGEEAA